MVVSFSHLVTFPDPIMSTFSSVSPNTFALATRANLPFLLYTFEALDPRPGIRYGGYSAEEIAAYTRPIPSLRSQSSKADATRWLTAFLLDQWPSRRVANALNHIDQVLRTPVWGPDMLLQISCDLDIAFFDGYLRNRIKVSWEDVYTTPHLGLNPMQVLGVTTFYKDDNTCHISLNRYAIPDGPIEPKTQTVQTLTHEMVVSSNTTKLLRNCTDYGPACLECPLFPW